jgi:spermidine synthase
MASSDHRSESALGEQAALACAGRRRPRLLLGGLGMGFTLRAALDVLPARAALVVAELHPAVIEWCRGPLAPLTRAVLGDPRVTVVCADVAELVRRAEPESFDAIALDLFEGPQAGRPGDPHFGRAALEQARAALAPGGALALWSEQPDPRFSKELARAGLRVSRARGGPRHAIYLAVREADTRGGRPRVPAARHRS